MRSPGRRIAWILGGLALGLVFVLGVRWFASPMRFVPEGRIWVFVSPGCPYSVDVYRQIRDAEDGAVAQNLVVVPADDSPGVLSRSLEMCDTTLGQIAWRERWIGRLVPKQVACRWLVEDASDLHDKLAVHWPAWYDGERIVRDDADLASLLATRGLDFDPATNTVLVRGQPVPAERRRQQDPAEAESVWDDLSEPHVIGW